MRKVSRVRVESGERREEMKEIKARREQRAERREQRAERREQREESTCPALTRALMFAGSI
jgi:hypothetical protein